MCIVAGTGGRSSCEHAEVGCPGFVKCSLCKVLLLPGITGQEKMRVVRSGSEAAEKATRCLWIKKADLLTTAAGSLMLRGLKPVMTSCYITDDASQHTSLSCRPQPGTAHHRTTPSLQRSTVGAGLHCRDVFGSRNWEMTQG